MALQKLLISTPTGLSQLPVADTVNLGTGAQANAGNLPLLDGNLVRTGMTLPAVPVVGEGMYVSANNTVARAIATAIGTARIAGVYAGTAAQIVMSGETSLLLDAGLNGGLVPAAGQELYISAATAGRFTNVAPLVAGNVNAPVGILLDAAGYDNGVGSAQPALFQPLTPIVVT